MGRLRFVFLIVGLVAVLAGCYYTPAGEQTADLYFTLERATMDPGPQPINSVRLELFLSSDVESPLPIGPNGELYRDFSLGFSPSYDDRLGPFKLENLSTGVEYVLRVAVEKEFSTASQLSAPFEVLPGRTTQIDLEVY